MKHCYQLLLLCLGVFTFSSCDKVLEDIVINPTNTELISGKTWRMVAETVSPPIIMSGVPVSDTYAQNDPCENDNELVFSSDNVFTMTAGPVACSAASTPYQVLATANWYFTDEEQKIYLVFEGQPEQPPVSIETLTKNKFIINEKWESSSTGLNHTRTITFEPVE